MLYGENEEFLQLPCPKTVKSNSGTRHSHEMLCDNSKYVHGATRHDTGAMKEFRPSEL